MVNLSPPLHGHSLGFLSSCYVPLFPYLNKLNILDTWSFFDLPGHLLHFLHFQSPSPLLLPSFSSSCPLLFSLDTFTDHRYSPLILTRPCGGNMSFSCYLFLATLYSTLLLSSIFQPDLKVKASSCLAMSYLGTLLLHLLLLLLFLFLLPLCSFFLLLLPLLLLLLLLLDSLSPLLLSC
jgi:hypothetical protein